MSLKSRTPLGRSSGLRSAGIKRGGKPVKKVNRKRRKSQFERAYVSVARVEFVQSLKCVGCSNPTTRSLNAHISNGGAGRKASYTKIIPLCFTCHGVQHGCGWSALPRLDTPEKREAAAAKTDAAFQAHLAHHGAEQ